jgi:hypothetical protein
VRLLTLAVVFVRDFARGDLVAGAGGDPVSF